ncbi:MAG: hypothetical protein LBC23_04815, partial [Coriobacteriales bacterium]|nr:hypothetical protein [Coriobacteriales bacterium]
SEGGVAVALAESCIAGGIGAVVALDDELPAASSLFSETQSRILVSVADESVEAVLALLAEAQVPYSVIGEVGGARLEVEDKLSCALEEIAPLYSESLEAQIHAR